MQTMSWRTVQTFRMLPEVQKVLAEIPYGEKSDFINNAILDKLGVKQESPKEQVAVANLGAPEDLVPSGSHKRSKNSDSEETKSEPPETIPSTPSTTKSTTQPTQNILRKLTSSAQS